MKIAIVHDWLVTYAGAERVLEQLIRLYPEADIFSVCDFIAPADRGFLQNKQVTTTFIQKLPFAKKIYRNYLPLMPLAIEQLDLSSYNLIISSSHAVAKGVLTGPDQYHICICYSPIRYAWDLQHQYLNSTGMQSGLKSWIIRYLLHRFRQWDLGTANGVDEFIAISDFIKRRICKVYRRSSKVIYPPVDVDNFEVFVEKSDFYLAASRMVPYKMMPMIVEAFSAMPDKKLIVIGDGPDLEKCKKLAGFNVIILGWKPNDVLRDYMQKAKAFVFAAEEDFGITPIEAQACGTPVIAYGKGALLETIVDINSKTPTGVLYFKQTSQSLQDAVTRFESKIRDITAKNCRRNAERFSRKIFTEKLSSLVAGCREKIR